MVDEYILKETVFNYLKHHSAFKSKSEIMQDIAECEPADVTQVVHGRWVDSNLPFGYFANCSACGYQMDVHAERGYFNFCPNCGAKMDREE